MFPLGSRALASHSQRSLLDIDVGPPQPQDLALPEPQGYGEDPATPVPPFHRSFEQFRDFVPIQGFDLSLVDARCLRDQGGVLGQVPTCDGFVQSGASSSVSLVRGSSRRAFLLHLPIHRFKVLRKKAMELVRTNEPFPFGSVLVRLGAGT